jgi:hypothetical protein
MNQNKKKCIPKSDSSMRNEPPSCILDALPLHTRVHLTDAGHVHEAGFVADRLIVAVAETDDATQVGAADRAERLNTRWRSRSAENIVQ